MDAPDTRWLDDLLADARLPYPPTPLMSDSVLQRIARPAPLGHRMASFGPAAAAVAIVLAAIVALVSISSTRESIAGFLGLAVEGEEIEVLPTPRPGVSATPLPSPPALESIAERVAPAEAAAALGFEPAAPSGESPLAIYLLRYHNQPVVVLRFAEYDLWQAQPGGFVGKGITLDGTVVEEARIGDLPAYWITGGPRLVTFRDADGSEIAGTQRTVTANTLVWSTPIRYYRIEGDITLGRALAIAATLP